MKLSLLAFALAFLAGCGEPSGSKLSSYSDLGSIKQTLQQYETQTAPFGIYGTYGKSQEGRDLMYFRLTSQMTEKPRVWLAGGMHGNEIGGVDVVMDAAKRFTEGYSAHDPTVMALLEKYEIYFLPVNNADGYYHGVREANGIDPNRDFPYPSDPQHTSNAAITNLMKFFDQTSPVGSIDFHTSGGLVMYPWGYTRNQIPESAEFSKLANKMAQTAGYQAGQISRILYIAQGSSADYYYWKKSTKAFAVEVGNYGREGVSAELTDTEGYSLWSMVTAFLNGI